MIAERWPEPIEQGLPGPGLLAQVAVSKHADHLPLLEAIRAWLEGERPRVLPQSPIGEAIGYALNPWAARIRPLEAGRLEIANGASERALKPVALS